MEKKAFELIAGRTEKVLEQQGFKRQKGYKSTEAGDMVLFLSENTAYSILYNKEGGQFELRHTAMTDEGPDDNHWKSISSWIFDPENDDIKEAESIASDFCNTLDDAKRRAAIRAAKRKATKDEDDMPGPVFFFKRLANVMPELRDEIAEERETYEDFRAVTFAKEKIVPKVDALAKKKGSQQMTKMCSVLNDFYQNGDMDVRSIITIVILNGVSEQSRANILENMDEDFRKYYPRALRYKGKNVRPERPKRKNRKPLGSRSPSYSEKPQRLSGRIPKDYR